MRERRRILVIHNPTAGRRRDLRLGDALGAMAAAGAVVHLHHTSGPGDAERMAREHDGPYDVVVASGGDGTVNEVVNGLSGRREDQHAPALGILPLGTANLLARELGYPRDDKAIGRLVATGRPCRVYLAACNGRLFTLMAGVGFDGSVVEGVDLAVKRRFGRLAYAIRALREIVAYDPAPCDVSVDGGAPVRAWAVVVAKGRRYGGSFHLARDADVRTPELHVCLFERRGRLPMLAAALGMPFGLAHKAPGFRVLRGSRVSVTGPVPAPVQVDGDRGWRLPVEIGTVRTPLAVVAP